jgi:hypothetical protein
MSVQWRQAVRVVRLASSYNTSLALASVLLGIPSDAPLGEALAAVNGYIIIMFIRPGACMGKNILTNLCHVTFCLLKDHSVACVGA